MLKFTAVVFAALVAMSARAQERISLDKLLAQPEKSSPGTTI